MEMVDELRPVLVRNYAALGFELLNLEQLTSSADDVLLRGKIKCPCGGVEFFSMILDTTDLGGADGVAKMILTHTASRSHLEQDVERGILPAFDIDKHCFNGTLL